MEEKTVDIETRSLMWNWPKAMAVAKERRKGWTFYQSKIIRCDSISPIKQRLYFRRRSTHPGG